MSREELQALYDQLGTTMAVAEHIGMSTAYICRFLRDKGVVVKKRGGRQFKARTTIERSRKTASGFNPVQIRECQEAHLPQPRPCVHHDLQDACEICRERYDLSAVSHASSGWTLEIAGARRMDD